MQHKSEVVKYIKSFLTYVMKQFRTQIKRIRSDNGYEFLNTELKLLLQEKGNIREISCPA